MHGPNLSNNHLGLITMPDFCDFHKVTPLGDGRFRHEAKCGVVRILPSDLPLTKVCNRSCDPSYVRPAFPTTGPGKELTGILKELGQTEAEDCGCTGHAAQMNLWGVDGCREHRDEIIGWLKESAAKAKLTKRQKFAIYRKARRLGIAIKLTDPFGSLVDEAIRRAVV